MSTKRKWPTDFLALLAKVTGRRARIVIDHILKHGEITTEDLENTYHYSHPPRAVQDVKDQGIPIITHRAKNGAGRNIAVYRFGDPADVKHGRIGGRKVFSKSFRHALVGDDPPQCAICSTSYESRYLQIDHRVPYEIAGDPGVSERDAGEYMLLCASCQRANSWSCEHCGNWEKGRLAEICERCYWTRPDTHEHIALKEIRRLDIVWLGEDEVKIHTRLRELATGAQIALPIYAKAALREYVQTASQ